MTAFNIEDVQPLYDGGKRSLDLSVTNGVGRVSLVVSDLRYALAKGKKRKFNTQVTLTPEKAVALAIALLNGARNVEAGVHGSSADAQYESLSNAHAALNLRAVAEG
ncbi:hypothetical protein [Agromyces sp. NPDC058104]|uniref:hypothetical protein n=1 Tax=Agromyces sp. NPDC058104 TaxID=3346342 RepID=UPI0036D7D305